ncbi:putative membrane protein YfcA [Bacillus fengqiuensis]|nr:putative membrane protein YfcA [Bacillus fengqiuensis]
MLFDLESSLLILLIILGFVAAFVDSVVGGVITLPALLMFMDCQWHFPEKLFFNSFYRQ